MKRDAVLSILVFAVLLAVGVKAEAQQQAKIPLVPPFESRNWLPTQADAAARSEFERAPRRGTNRALPTDVSPEPSEAKPRFSLNTRAIDYSPVQRYSSRQRKRVFKFPVLKEARP
jgi:hypothetical protein